MSNQATTTVNRGIGRAETSTHDHHISTTGGKTMLYQPSPALSHHIRTMLIALRAAHRVWAPSDKYVYVSIASTSAATAQRITK